MGVSNDSLCHVVMNCDVLYILLLLYGQRRERCSLRHLPRPSNPSTYCCNSAVNTGRCSHKKRKSYLRNMNHNLTKLICHQISSDKYFTGAFCEFECHCFTSKSQEGIQNSRIWVLHANSHCQQCANKCTAVYMYVPMSQHSHGNNTVL